MNPPSESPLLRQNIDLGLAVLSVVNTGHQRMTLEDIADVCECSIERVRQIEERALKKLRARLRLSNMDEDARDMIRVFTEK